ncbi:MAG: ABC transporter ATP-binding protein [Alphaproteobacteria bacterium]|nr:ABC transporter ATP-binding protein [Alphaproteobacteria bacterium]
MNLLEIKNLSVEFPISDTTTFKAVDNLTITLNQGETLGIVGESGSGKSMAMLALMGLVPWPGKIKADKLSFNGKNLFSLSTTERRKILGKDIAMIFQEPTSSLNPCFTTGFQIMETLAIHEGGSKRLLRKRAIELLDQVGISDPKSRLDSFPHQLSGGMNQRIMIAMAIACNPRLLIADEPTTALDVTIQAQILDLLRVLRKERNMGLILITHDMGVVAEMSEKVMVMYAGQQMEMQDSNKIFFRPHHPYTAALLNALPERSIEGEKLPTIPGVVPGVYDRPSGCLFHPRCQYAQIRCQQEIPLIEGITNTQYRCHFPLNEPLK